VIPTSNAVRGLVAVLLDEWDRDGHDVTALRDRLATAGANLDELAAIAVDVMSTPVRADWPWHEPDDLPGIEQASAGDWNRRAAPVTDGPARVEAAFLGRVAGCMLGKPLELELSRTDLEAGLRRARCWPLDDYLPEAALDQFPTRQGQWPELVRERIAHVAPDDDINYTILAMLALEACGTEFSQADLAGLWRLHLPIAATFGPERALLAGEAFSTTLAMAGIVEPRLAVTPLPGADLCGALIRADAYGYACAGDPATAARLAHRDATLTHHRTGVYGAMWVAATIAEVLACHDPIEAATTALGCVPTRSRFHDAVSGALDIVADAVDWESANEAIVARHPDHGHCRILQEVGTLIVSWRFAHDIGHGICLQVSQGNDTDSFGATAGSVLGAALGTGHLDRRWLAPFNDTIHVAMALFEPPGLAELAARMGRLAA